MFNLKISTRVFMLTIIFLMLQLPTKNHAGLNDSTGKFYIELELGPVWQSRNDVQIPNTENGTRFSLVDLVGQGPYPSPRLYVSWQISTRHDLRLLLAPLSYTENGQFNTPVLFEGETFQAGVPTDATYKFNSWRITYRYRFHNGEQWRWWIGFTAKIRDAKIQLDQSNASAKKTDLGFVPLLHIRGEYHFNSNWWLLLDLDALAGGPGRAEDGTIKLAYDFNDHWSLAGGYRTVEGGADVDEVYNFAWLHYLVLSATYTF
jgi:hypothetical protein